KTFTVTLDSATNALINPVANTGTATIQNDDAQPTVSISPASLTQAEGNSDTTPFSFDITLSNPSSVPVTVSYSTADGTATLADSDYTDTNETLTFTPGTPLTQTVTIDATGDSTFEPDETFTIAIDSATNATVDPLADAAIATIQNDDAQPTVSISPATLSQQEGDSGTTATSFTVSLSNPSGEVVTVSYSTNDGTATLVDGDYTDNDGTLTFNPGGSLSQTVTVLVNGETKVETDEDFTVTLDSATNATIAAGSATGTIVNDDVNQAPVVTNQSFTLDENSPNATSVGVVVASDPNTGDTLSFAIAGGTGSSAFSVNSATGEITVTDTSQLDFESNSSFTLDIEVSDGSLT
ncbi:MAG: Calx-beta domain-containing protein, partial [Cyanobacteria bacterium J06648_11]